MKLILIGLIAFLSPSASGGAPTTAPVAAPSTRSTAAPQVFKLRLRAAATTTPALRYELLPDAADQTRGNAAQAYLLAITLAAQAPAQVLTSTKAATRDATDSLAFYLDQSLDQLDVEGASILVEQYKAALDEVQRAMHCESVDWQIPWRDQGFATVLPHLTGMRQISNVLRLRARLEIRRHDFEAALRSIQSGLAMARSLNQQDVLVQALVGISIANTSLAEVRELIQQPGSPNLYWGLAQLPKPFINLRSAFADERAMLFASLPQLRKAESGTITAQDWQDMLHLMDVMGFSAFNNQLSAAALGAAAYPAAKKYLTEKGMSSARIDALTPRQAVARFWIDNYLAWSDDLTKWYSMPYWQAQPHILEAEHAFAKDGERTLNPLLSILPGLGAVNSSAAAVDRSIAALQTIEALRDYAAGHAGKFPDSLADLTDTPTPIDPMTGKLFQYQHEAQKAVLIAFVPEGVSQRFSQRYELNLDHP